MYIPAVLKGLEYVASSKLANENHSHTMSHGPCFLSAMPGAIQAMDSLIAKGTPMHETNDALETHVLPCAEAVLAGTLALMTGHAQCGCKNQKRMMASKISANLAGIDSLTGLSPNFKIVMQRLQAHWERLAATEYSAALHADGMPTDSPAAHAPPALVQ
jgi:hypothetical protein